MPISVEFSEDNRKLLVCSNKRKIRMMDTRNIDANFQRFQIEPKQIVAGLKRLAETD